MDKQLQVDAIDPLATLRQIVIEATESPNCDAARLEVIRELAERSLAGASALPPTRRQARPKWARVVGTTSTPRCCGSAGLAMASSTPTLA